jgi:hypothetical protein
MSSSGAACVRTRAEYGTRERLPQGHRPDCHQLPGAIVCPRRAMVSMALLSSKIKAKPTDAQQLNHWPVRGLDEQGWGPSFQTTTNNDIITLHQRPDDPLHQFRARAVVTVRPCRCDLRCAFEHLFVKCSHRRKQLPLNRGQQMLR